MARASTTKSLASRIELTYYKKRHPLRRWRMGLAAAAFLVPIVLLGGLVVAGDDRAWSPGPVSAAHAAIAARCDDCHTPWGAVLDVSCSRCHAGPAHHECAGGRGSLTFTPRCASCHREHGGRATLARPEDAHCSQCHSDLAAASATPPRFVPSITSFADHPEFAFARSAAADPGTIALDHQRHLTLVMPGLGRAMQCADCHVPDATGRTMEPISFERHCASCHELGLKGRLDGVAVTHGRQLGALDEELRAAATARALAGPPEEAGLDRSRRAAKADATLRAWIDETVAEAGGYLAKVRCAECHRFESAPDGAAGMSATIAAARIPARWLPHARFDHQRHRALACTSCHAGVTTSTRTADVHLPGIESCRACHSPAVGTRSDCALCHGYHGGAAPR